MTNTSLALNRQRLVRGLEYFMDMVVIDIGMMQLTHSFQTRREQLMFSVKLGTSNAVLDLKTPSKKEFDPSHRFFRQAMPYCMH
jgi:hypothetical protein